MLNPFPFLLELSFFTPVVLRIALSLFFLLIGKQILFTNRKDLVSHFKKEGAFLPRISIWILGIITILIGGFIFIGFLTQYAALISAGFSIYFGYLHKKTNGLVSHSIAAYYFAIFIAIVLILNGAGPFAVDIPL